VHFIIDMKRPSLKSYLLAVSFFTVNAFATSIAAQSPSQKFSAQEREAITRSAIALLNESYVFPDLAKAVEADLNKKLKAKTYADMTDAEAFAKALTSDIQAVTKDRHIKVRYSPTPLPERAKMHEPTEAEMAAEIAAQTLQMQKDNFDIARVERLPGNIGYIDLRGFAYPALAGDAIAAAMSLVAHTDALIVDLTKNRGGHPPTVALMISYLLDDRTHLNDFYHRTSNTTTQQWTYDYVPGKRFGGTKPIYVLTSPRTFSGAEEFAYNLKHLKRATIVGETTGGGAHPGGYERLNNHFTLFVPQGRPINQVTKTNWEGAGVEPDVKVAAADALRTAQLIALKKLKPAERDSSALKQIDDRITELEVK
jgi:C-terminal processing protease CtpA/Prc